MLKGFINIFMIISYYEPLKVIFNQDRNISVMPASQINIATKYYFISLRFQKQRSTLFEAGMLSILLL